MKMMYVGGRKHGDIEFSDYPPEQMHMLKESPPLNYKTVPNDITMVKLEKEIYNRNFILLSPQAERVAVYRHEDVGDEQWKIYLLTRFNIT